MRAGPVVLPSVHFHDLKKRNEAPEVAAPPAIAVKRVRRSAKN